MATCNAGGASRGGGAKASATGAGSTTVASKKAATRESSYKLTNNFSVSPGDRFSMNGLINERGDAANISVHVKEGGIVTISPINNPARFLVSRLNRTKGIGSAYEYTGNIDDVIKLIRENSRSVTLRKSPSIGGI